MCYCNAAFFVSDRHSRTYSYTTSEEACHYRLLGCRSHRFVFKVRSELKATRGYVAAVAEGKRHCQDYDCIRTPEFVNSVQAAVDEDPGKSMRALSNEL